MLGNYFPGMAVVANLCVIIAYSAILLRLAKWVDARTYYKWMFLFGCGTIVIGSLVAEILGTTAIFPSWSMNVFTLGAISYGTILVVDLVYALLLACIFFPFLRRGICKPGDTRTLQNEVDGFWKELGRTNRFRMRVAFIGLIGVLLLGYVLPWIFRFLGK